MNYRYYIIDGALCIFAKYRDGLDFVFFPLGAGGLFSVLDKISDITGFPVILCPLTEEMARCITAGSPNLTPEYRRDLSDYIYGASDLAALAGKKFHKKRNHVNKFKSLYEYNYHTIAPGDTDLLRRAAEVLHADEEKLDPDMADEFTAINELIDNFAALKLKAGVITVGDTIIAYSIGEYMCENMALVHAEKADRRFDGGYAVINYEFARNELNGVKYINREEDMGIDGLRQAKTSYNPIALNNVYSISFNNKEDLNHVKSCNVKQMARSCGRVCQ